MGARRKTFFPDPCARIVSGVFGAFFLLAVLFVPCTRMVTKVRPDPSGRFATKITIPRSVHIFLPRYLAQKSRAGPRSGNFRMKTLQWTGTMALVAVLGVFDIVFVCPVFRKRRRAGEGDDDDAGRGGESGFSLRG